MFLHLLVHHVAPPSSLNAQEPEKMLAMMMMVLRRRWRTHKGNALWTTMLPLFLVVRVTWGGIEIRKVACQDLNYCNGHGRCVSVTKGSPTMTCECFEGACKIARL